jgi:opacity protein-like surface antigen
MRSYLLGGACAASMLLALTPVVQAADFEPVPEPAGWGWYLSVFGGWSSPTGDHDFFFSSGTGTGFTSVNGEVDLDDGFMAGLALGAHINEWLRGEIELSGHWHDADGLATLGSASLVGSPTPVLVYSSTTVGLEGDANALFVLANLWVDIPIDDMIRPYIGGGVGIGRLDLDLETSGGSTVIDDSDWAFAYQVGAGVAFGFSPNLALDIGYRYKVINDVELDAVAPSGAGFEVETDYKSHNVLVGLRFGF